MLPTPQQHGAIAAMLVRVHGELREELAVLREEFDVHVAGLDRPVPSLGTQLARHCLAFCGALRTHHTGEDSAFDVLERQFPDLAPALGRMRDEHRVVAKTLTGPRSADRRARVRTGAARQQA